MLVALIPGVVVLCRCTENDVYVCRRVSMSGWSTDPEQPYQLWSAPRTAATVGELFLLDHCLPASLQCSATRLDGNQHGQPWLCMYGVAQAHCAPTKLVLLLLTSIASCV